MSALDHPGPRSSGPRRLLAGLCLAVIVLVSGCSLVGGEDEGGDEDYPEPPGRPNAVAVDQLR